MECTEWNLIERVGPSTTHNLITHAFTVCHVKLTQSTVIEEKAFRPSIIVALDYEQSLFFLGLSSKTPETRQWTTA